MAWWWKRSSGTASGRPSACVSWLLTTLIDPSMPTTAFLEQFDAMRNAESDGQSEDRNSNLKPAEDASDETSTPNDDT